MVLTLCILAHQDDEMAMASRIRHEVRGGRSVCCVFLTDGGAGKASPTARDAESRAVLGRLGVPADQIFFLGSRHQINDGRLVDALDHSLDLTEQSLRGQSIGQIFSLAFEGGHPDHDASHLIALALAQRRGLEDQVWQFPLYRRSRAAAGLHRVMAPFNSPGLERQTRRLGLREGLSIAALWLRYHSQWRSTLGLLPEALLRLTVQQQETMLRADPAAVRDRPHPGRLFYEQRFGVDYDAWRAQADAFIRRHLAELAPAPAREDAS